MEFWGPDQELFTVVAGPNKGNVSCERERHNRKL